MVDGPQSMAWCVKNDNSEKQKSMAHSACSFTYSCYTYKRVLCNGPWTMDRYDNIDLLITILCTSEVPS